MMLKRTSLIVALLFLAVFFSGFNGVRIGASLTVGDLVLIVLGGLWLIAFPLKSHVRLALPVLISLVMFTIALALTTATGYSTRGVAGDVSTFAKVLVTFYALPYLIADIAKSERRVRLVVAAYVLSATTNSVVSLTDTLGLSDFQSWFQLETVGGWSYESRFHGLSMHPNHLGQQCAMAMFLAFGLVGLRANSSQVSRYFWLGSAAILFMGVLGSGSRGALLAVAGSGILVLLAYKRRVLLRRRNMSMAVVLSLLLIGAGAYVNSRTEIAGATQRLLGGGEGVLASNEARMASYLGAMQDFASNPISGLGFAHLGGVDNVYIQFLQGAGVIGLVGFVIYLWPAMREGLRILNGEDDVMLLSVVGAVGVFVLTCLTQNLVYARFTLIPMGVLWALRNARTVIRKRAAVKVRVSSIFPGST